MEWVHFLVRRDGGMEKGARRVGGVNGRRENGKWRREGWVFFTF